MPICAQTPDSVRYTSHSIPSRESSFCIASASRLVGGNSRMRRFRGARGLSSLCMITSLWHQAVRLADISRHARENPLKVREGLADVNAFSVQFQFTDRLLVLAAPLFDYRNGSAHLTTSFEE